MDRLPVAGLQQGLPAGSVTTHLRLLPVAIAGLMRIADDVTMIFVAQPDIQVEIIAIITCSRIIRASSFLPGRGQAADQYRPPDARAIQASGCPLDDLDGLEIVKAQLVQIGITPRIGKRDLVPVNLDIPDSERRA